MKKIRTKRDPKDDRERVVMDTGLSSILKTVSLSVSKELILELPLTLGGFQLGECREERGDLGRTPLVLEFLLPVNLRDLGRRFERA